MYQARPSAAPPRGSSGDERSRPWSPREAAVLALAVVLVAALLAHFHDRFWYPPDEGAYAHVAERVLAGEVLNRDVQDIHLGYVNFLHAATFAVAGPSLVALRYPLVLVSLATALLAFGLFRRHGTWTALVAAVTVVSFGVLQYLDPTAHWYSLLFFHAIAAVLAFRPPGRGRDLALGTLLGVMFGFRQLSAVFTAMGVLTYLFVARRDDDDAGPPRLARLTLVVMALGLTAYLVQLGDLSSGALFGAWPLFLLLWAFGRTRLGDRAAWRLFGWLGLGALAALLPLLAYHAYHGSFASWYGDVVLAARAQSQLAFTRQFSYASTLFSGGLATALRGPGLAARINGLYWAGLALAATLAGLALLARLRVAGSGDDGARLAPLPVLASFYALVSLHFQNVTYLAFGVTASLLALLWLLAERGGRGARWAPLVVACGAAIAVHYHAAEPTRLNLEQMLAGERVAPVEADLPRCGLWLDPEQLRDTRAALELIEREVPPGGTIFVLPNDPELYFLSGRRNPFRFYNFAPGVRSEEEMRRVLAVIRAEPPRLLFYDGLDKYNTRLSRQLIVALAQGPYELLGNVGPWNVFRPRAAAGTATPPSPAPEPAPSTASPSPPATP